MNSLPVAGETPFPPRLASLRLSPLNLPVSPVTPLSLLPGSVPGNLALIPLRLRSFVAAGSHPLGFSGGCSLAPQLS